MHEFDIDAFMHLKNFIVISRFGGTIFSCPLTSKQDAKFHLVYTQYPH